MHKIGFSPPRSRPLGVERRTAMVAELITSATLAVCILAVATVLTIGMARAG